MYLYPYLCLPISKPIPPPIIPARLRLVKLDLFRQSQLYKNIQTLLAVVLCELGLIANDTMRFGVRAEGGEDALECGITDHRTTSWIYPLFFRP